MPIQLNQAESIPINLDNSRWGDYAKMFSTGKACRRLIAEAILTQMRHGFVIAVCELA
jgi:hypothetical protein